METGRSCESLDQENLRLFQGDPLSDVGRKAASDLLGRHQQRIYLWCYRFVRNHEQALDLAQDVMLRAYEKLPGYQPRARFSSWLFVIARNRCLSDARKPSITTVLGLDPDGIQSGDPGPARQLAEKDLWRIIARHLDRQEVDALHLRCVEGFPVEAITEILGIASPSGARGVLQRARRKLKAALG